MRLFASVVLAIVLVASRSNAQCSRGDSAPNLRDAPPRGVRSAADDSARLGSLLGACWGNGSLIRSVASLTPPADSVPGVRWSALDPRFATIWNSRLPVTQNDGAMWAGRGLNIRASAGFSAEHRYVRFIFAPAVVSSQNLPFPILPSTDPAKSGYASPWHSGAMVADLPSRFGNERYTRLDPGESALEIMLPIVAVGASSSVAWWGPGIHNALVMSDNAAGIPRVYLRTVKPLSSKLGDVEAQWMLGGLAESPFFDTDERNNLRSVSGAVVTLRLAADTGLTIGAARVVYAGVRRFGRVPGHFADVFTDWHRPPMQGAVNRKSDQLISFFARWVFPAAGVAAHAEWAKVRLPASLRELMIDPQFGQGYTVGLEWANELSAGTTLRVQAEATTLEQTPESTGGITPEFYASHSVLHGYTHQGQTVGAAIGPGSSSQHLDASLFRRGWRFGGTVGRIRWEEEAYYREPSQGRFAWRAHDVSLLAGLGAAREWRAIQVEAALLRTWRLNYLFQTPNAFLPENASFDIGNTTLSLTVTPRLSRRASRNR